MYDVMTDAARVMAVEILFPLSERDKDCNAQHGNASQRNAPKNHNALFFKG
jgi:hypothetical protein